MTYARSSCLLDISCIAFALFSVLSHVGVSLGASPSGLGLSALGLLAACLSVGAWQIKLHGLRATCLSVCDPQPIRTPVADVPGDEQPMFGLARWALGLGAVGLVGFYMWTGDEERLAFAAVPLILLSAALAWRAPIGGAHRASVADGGRGLPQHKPTERWLWLLAVLSALFTLCAKRPDTDEGFYLAVPMMMLREPQAAVLGFDPVHGVLDWPLQLAVYRAHSMEVLAGLLSRALDIRPIYIVHVLFAGWAGLLLPLAWCRLFGELLPRWATLCAWLTVGLLVADGGTNQSYGNFAMVRLFQGKAIFLSVAVPAISTYALRFAKAPSGKRLALLLCAQVAGMGLSSIALPLAPMLAAVGLLGGLPWGSLRTALRRFSTGLLASLYPLSWGVLYYVQMVGGHGIRPRAPSSSVAATASQVLHPALTAAERLEEAYSRVLSEAPIRWGYLAALLILPLIGRTPTLRRFAAAGGLVFFGVLVNPALQNLVEKNVFGNATYWRVFWLLPLPAFTVATVVCLSAGLQSRLLRFPRLGSSLSAGLLAAGLVWCVGAFLPAGPVFAATNRFRVGLPGPKVDAFYRSARRASELAPRDSRVVAHPYLAGWLAAFEKPVYPIYVKRTYLRGPEKPMRQRVTRCVFYGGRGCRAATMVRDLQALGVSTIVLEPTVDRWMRNRKTSLVTALGRLGFERATGPDTRAYWVRPVARTKDEVPPPTHQIAGQR